MEIVKIIITIHFVTNTMAEQFLAKEHVTTKAAGKLEDVWCYTCDTMEHDHRCVDLSGNHSSLIRKCPEENRICMVKRISITTSTENSTSSPRMWSLARNCSTRCEAGCIVVGERTKVFACTSCCESSLCNVGTGDTCRHVCAPPLLLVLLLLLVLAASS